MSIHEPNSVNKRDYQSATEAPFMQQLEYLRALEPPTDPAFLLQVLLILAVSFSGYAFLGIWEPAVWAVAYVCAQFGEKVVVRTVPDNAGSLRYGIVLLVLFIESCVYCLMPIYLWFYGTDVAKLAAAALMTASAMHTTQNRAVYPSILACFLIPNASIVFAIAFLSILPEAATRESVVYAAIGCSTALFFIVMFSQAYQKEMRSRMTEEALGHAQRLETVGKLTGGIAHDFNNLISVVSSNLQLITDTDDLAEAKLYAERANSAANASAELTAKMLAFGRKAPLRPTHVRPEEAFRDLHAFTDRIVPKSITIEYEISPGTRSLFVDRSMLQNALLNLVINAADAMPNGGKLWISASTNISGDVVIKVADNGPGIPVNIQEQVLEPFFTTKEDIGRSGMGLAMVQGFVEQSQGSLQLHSSATDGTTVELRLPATDESEPDKEAAVKEKPKMLSVAAKNIMLVDDNKQLLQAIEIKLRRDGHKVIAFLSGDEAVVALKHATPVDLLITDAVMPGETQGIHLIEAVRASGPHIPTILMSGYADTAFGDDIPPGLVDRFFVKPVNLGELSEAIDDLLTSTTAAE